jgi:hypothetical protein
VRYGQREDVRRNLLANHQTGGWAVSSVAHDQQKKTALLDLKHVEDNENVRRWLDEYIDELNQLVEHFTIVEERDDLHNPLYKLLA